MNWTIDFISPKVNVSTYCLTYQWGVWLVHAWRNVLIPNYNRRFIMIDNFVHFIFWKVRWYHREYGFEDVIVWLNITLLNENESNNRFHLSWRQCAPVYKITFYHNLQRSLYQGITWSFVPLNNNFNLFWRQWVIVYKIAFIIVYSGLYTKEPRDLLTRDLYDSTHWPLGGVTSYYYRY